MKKAIDIVAELYINQGKSIVSLQADFYINNDLVNSFDRCRYAFDGETTLNEFINMYIIDCLENYLDNIPDAEVETIKYTNLQAINKYFI